jgi:curved DNA-binding protein
LETDISVSLEDVALGSEKRISFRWGDRVESLSVKIPKGIEDGKKLRIPGKGQESPFGGPRGDLYLRVKILEHPVFQRQGRDLIVDREIPFSHAVLGTTVEIPTLEGKTLRVKIPPGTDGQARIRVRGHGLPSLKGGGKGDLYVKVRIRVPKQLTPAQRELVEKLRDVGL